MLGCIDDTHVDAQLIHSFIHSLILLIHSLPLGIASLGALAAFCRESVEKFALHFRSLREQSKRTSNQFLLNVIEAEIIFVAG